MKATICDVCKEPIPDQTSFQRITIGTMDGETAGAVIQPIKDICMTCWTNPVILSEMRRTRTRKPKAKPGRPKGSKNKEAAPE